MKRQTQLIRAGLAPSGSHMGLVNPPVSRGSTVLFPDLESLYRPETMPSTYARHRTPTSMAAEQGFAALEAAEGCVLASSGLEAITLCLQAFCSAGCEILVCDNCYAPVRQFCDGFLRRYGVKTHYFDPHIGAHIESLFHKDTKLIWLESPGSGSFEICDVPAIIERANRRNIATICDNTWGAGVFFRPLEHGATASMQSLSKYVGGHADLIGGFVCAAGEALETLKKTRKLLGIHNSGDDLYLALRGLRSLHVRMRHQHSVGLDMAEWLSTRPEISRVIHPARADHPDHALWQRDFSGANSLFGFVLRKRHPEALKAMMNSLRLFGIGYSWGGFESLLLPVDLSAARSASPWSEPGQLMRIYIGLEDPSDLQEDLQNGLERWSKTLADSP